MKDETKILSINDILNSEDINTDIVETPEWGGSIRIQEMTGEALDEYESSMWDIVNNNGKVSIERNKGNMRAKLIAACAVNNDGTKMFKGPDQVAALGRKNGKVLERIYKKCQELNAIGKESEQEGKSETDQSSGSCSDTQQS